MEKSIPLVTELFAKVLTYFRGDVARTCQFFLSDNPALGGIAPCDFVALGRMHKLANFINTAIEENKA